MGRITVLAIWVLTCACQYSSDDLDDGFVSCSAHSDCGETQRCGGVLSSDESCHLDGYLGVDDDGIFPFRPTDQDSMFFQCDQGRRHYSYCTTETQSVCDDSLGGLDHICGKPLDGTAERTYPVALRDGSDELWQCNPDLTCNDTTTVCLRLFEYDLSGYKVNRRVCVPKGLVVQPAWAE